MWIVRYGSPHFFVKRRKCSCEQVDLRECYIAMADVSLHRRYKQYKYTYTACDYMIHDVYVCYAYFDNEQRVYMRFRQQKRSRASLCCVVVS